MEPSTSKPVDTSRIKIKEEPIENPFETSNEKYLQSKAEKEAKRKRKREEKKSPGRWTRSDETKLLAEKHKRIKKQ
ncbi:hypothetical protein Tco_0644766 [Tanacetum coccineum]